MKHLVLKDKQDKIVRVFPWEAERAFIVYREKIKRLDICPKLDSYKNEKISVLEEVQKSKFNSPLALPSGHFIELCDPNKLGLSLAVAPEAIGLKYFWNSIALVQAVFVLIVGILFLFKSESPTQPEKPVQKIVKIIKPKMPEKVQVNSHQLYSRDSAVKKVVKKKVVKKSLKRMSALGALGSLSKNQTMQEGGLNLNNSKISQGPGLRALAENDGGSGGVQTSVYSKGLVTLALGSGGNAKGGGGYRTKGGSESGGGQAGYGQLNLAGSAGDADLSESSALNSEGGAFDPNLIHKSISKKAGQIRNCYDEALKTEPDLKGIFSADFVINSRGIVRNSKMHSESAIRSQGVARCILSVLNTVKFNISSQKQAIRVIYKFDLISLKAGSRL